MGIIKASIGLELGLMQAQTSYGEGDVDHNNEFKSLTLVGSPNKLLTKISAILC